MVYTYIRGVGTRPVGILVFCRGIKISPDFIATKPASAYYDRSLAPKVVQIIESYNKLRAVFAIFLCFRARSAVAYGACMTFIFGGCGGALSVRAAEDNAA